MAELIQQYRARYKNAQGRSYAVRAYAEEGRGGIWIGWLQFHPVAGRGAVLRTGPETSQPTRVTLEYWASGLEPLYFEGAFERARDRAARARRSLKSKRSRAPRRGRTTRTR